MSASASDGIPIETLLEHRAWVRTLARSLVSDPHRAADVEQEAWRLAIERPPRHDRGLRTWFASVVRNAARSAGRRSATRRRLEAAAPRADAPRSPVDLLAEAELQQRLVQAVLELEPAYRTVVLRRYFEGLTPTRISEQDGSSVETVKTRLKRARTRLRDRLQPPVGEGRRAWCLLAGIEGVASEPPTVQGPRPQQPPWLRWRTPQVARVALVLAAGVATVGCLWERGNAGDDADRMARGKPLGDVELAPDEPPQPRRGAARGQPPRPAAESSEPLSVPVAGPDSLPSVLPEPGEPSDPAPSASTRKFVAWVVDTSGAPVPGANVTLDPAEMDDEPTRATDECGCAEFVVIGPVRSATLAVRTADGRALRPRHASKSLTEDADRVRFVVEFGNWVTGRVLRDSGKPFRFALVYALVDGREIGRVVADEEGVFEISLPAGERCTLALTGGSSERYPGSRNTPQGRRRRGMGRWGPWQGELVDVLAGTSGVELVARRAEGVDAIRVRAQRTDGRAVTGVTVFASLGLLQAEENAPPTSAQTDSTGRCVFEGRNNLRVRVGVSMRAGLDRPWERAGWVTPTEVLLARPGPAEYVLRFVPGRMVRGRVLLPPRVAGWPAELRRCGVSFSDGDRQIAGAYTEPDGGFTALIPKSFSGTLRVGSSASGRDGYSFVGETRLEVPDEDEVTIRLEPRVW